MPVRRAARVAEREVRFFASVWQGVVFTTFVMPCLFLVAFGLGLGGLVDEGATSLPEGLDYLSFLAPGLTIGMVSQQAAGFGLWPIMAGHRWLGTHRAMVATPLGPDSIVAGLLLWVGGRAGAQAVVLLTVAAALGAVSSLWAVMAVPVTALAAVSLAAPLMAYTASRDSDRTFDPIMRILISPMYLFSGAVFDVATLPAALQTIVAVFPLWHAIELARLATAGAPTAWWPGLHLAVTALWAAAGWLIARRTFTTRLAP